MSIKNIILDAGGVLTHPFAGAWDIPVGLTGGLRETLLTPEGIAARAKFAPVLREDVFVSTMEEERALRRAYLSGLSAALDWRLTEDELSALAEDFTCNLSRYAWFPDVEPALKRLHARYCLGVLSDAMPSLRASVLAHDEGHLISGMVLSVDVGATKPAAAMYAAICRKLAIAPAESVFVDDRICNLEGALRYGMRAVQMDREGGIPLWDGPVVRDFAGLEAYLEGQP